LQAYSQLKRLTRDHFPQEPLKSALSQFAYASAKSYFLTKFLSGKDKAFRDLCECLSDLYTYDEDNTMLDFNGAVVPKSALVDNMGIFEYEFFDIVFPYLVNSPKFCDCFYKEGPYEIERVCIVSEGDVIIDCGANMGFFSAVASSKGATVYAFEPFEHVIENYLSKIAISNPNINICKLALSDKEETLSFVQNFERIDCGRLLKSPFAKSGQDIITVQAIPLDTFVERNNISQVDFIKADIEGAERYLLMGAKQVLEEFSPKISICTYHLPDDPQVLRQLILDANPNYIIEERFKKMYAYVL